MATYIIEVNEKNSFAKKLINLIIDYAKQDKSIKLLKEPNKTTKKAIEEARKGGGKAYKNAQELIDSL